MIIYDLECEQEWYGTALLVSFIIYISNVVFRIPTIKLSTDKDGFICQYIMGSNCVEVFCNLIDKVINTSRCKTWMFFAHNGLKFDHLYLIPYLNKKWNVGECIRSGSGFIHLMFESNDNVIYMKDTYRYLNFPLKKFKAASGLSKIDLACDFSEEFCLSAECIDYCCRDVNVLTNLVRNIIPSYFNAFIPMCYSKSFDIYYYYSQADAAYNMCLKSISGCNVLAICDDYYDCYKHCYYGARTDSCMYGMKLEGKFKAYDISSMYPAGMNNPMPDGNVVYMNDYMVDWNDYNPHLYLPFICKARLIKTWLPGYGILPYHWNKHGGGDVVGEIGYINGGDVTGSWTCIDLYNAVNDGWKVVWCKHFIVWERWTNEFQKFYKKWFDIKQATSDPNLRWSCKIVLNSSIGKFAQKTYGGINKKPSQLGWFCLSYSRCLHSKLKQLLPSDKYVYYGDTDSIFIDECIDLPDAYLNKMVLGDMNNCTGEVECVFDTMIVIGKKMYLALKDGVVVKCGHKGIPKLTVDMANDLLSGKTLSVTYMQPAKWVKSMSDIKVTKFWNVSRNVRITIPTLRCKHDCFYFIQSIKTF